MSTLKIVIFDCDGVMFDSRDANRHYYNHLLEHFGHPAMDDDELQYVHTHSVKDSVAHIFRGYPAEQVEAVHRYRQRHSYIPYLDYMTIEPDLKEFLHFLRPAHYTAISTNRTSTMPALLEKYGLPPLFDMVVTAQDVQNPKPHPEALIKILDHFALQAHQALFIGDSDIDREHASGLDMRFAAYKSPSLQADFHVDSFMQIAGLPLFA